MADENDIKNLSDYNELLEEVLTNQQKLAEEMQKIFKAFGETMESSIGSSEEAARKMRQIIDVAIDQEKLTEEQAVALHNIHVLLDNQVEVEGEKLDIGDRYNNILTQTLKLYNSQIKQQKESNVEQAKSLSLAEKYRVQREEILNLSSQQAKHALANLLMNNSLVNTVKQLLTTYSSISAELNKLTLDGDRYADVTMNAAEAVAGVSFAESTRATTELIQGMSDFTRMTQEAQTELVATTAQFEKLGISAKNQVLLNQMATKSFGMSAKQATNFYAELVQFSKDADVPMTEIDKNLGSIGNKLALFGRENYQQVFKDLTVAAKDFGIEAGKMLDVTERFTTFEGAAQAAGRLNAILGGNFVSGLGLMTSALESPVDVFRQLKTAMDMSGKEFANMSQAQKRYIAEKIGVSLTEAESLFGNSLNESTQRLQTRQATQEELNKLSAKSTEVFERLRIAMLKIVNSPFVGAITSAVEGLASLLEAVQQGEKEFAGSFLGGLLLAVGALGLLLKGFRFLLSPIFAVIGGLRLFWQWMTGSAGAATTQTAVLNANTAALQANRRALILQARAQQLASRTSAGLGAGLIKLALIIGGLGLVLAIVAGAFALWNKYQAENTRATTEQAKVFSNLATTIKEMSNLKSNLESFAQGIASIGKAINTINLATLKEMNALMTTPFNAEFTTRSNATVETRVIPVKVVEIEMNATREEERQQMSLINRGKETNKEVKISINSPISLDGADWGRLISNAIGIYEESQGREITPGLAAYRGGDILKDR